MMPSHHLYQYTDQCCTEKHAPTELEVAALIFAVKNFEMYLLGKSCTVYTDHQALVNLFIVHLKSQIKGHLAHW